MAKGEIEHLAKRCASCKHYYLSPCGTDEKRLQSCPNWSFVQGKVRTARVVVRRPKVQTLPDHEGPIPDRTEKLTRVSEPRVKITKKGKSWTTKRRSTASTQKRKGR